MYENIYGLSCVENHILVILKNRGMNIAPLYNNCAMPLKEIFYYMVLMGEKPEYFSRIPRIQEILKSLGIINLELIRQDSLQSVCNEIRSCKENEFILMKVTSAFTTEVLHARGLRDDHFVIVNAIGSDFTIQNDIPEMTIVLTAEQMTKAYGGDCLKMTVKRELTNIDENSLWESQIFVPENHMAFYFNKKDFTDVSNLGVKLRDMTGIYKTLRKRMAIYYNIYVDTKFIDDAMPTIEKYYALIEYYNLKNIALDRYCLLLNELNKTEINIITELKYKLDNSKIERYKAKWLKMNLNF